MVFSPKCRTKKLGMIYTILGSFCFFFNWEGAQNWPHIRLRKIPVCVYAACLNLTGFAQACYVLEYRGLF